MKKLGYAWIALSAQGQPAWFLGYWRTRKALMKHYQDKFRHDLERAGYRPLKVELKTAGPSPKESIDEC